MTSVDPAPSLKKMRRTLFWLGIKKIPLIGFIFPRLQSIDEREAVINIPLNWRTKNHLGSMYFGALCTGADLAGGIQVLYFQDLMNIPVSFAFKEFKAQFIKRAESPVTFKSSQGMEIKEALLRSKASGQRENLPIQIVGFNRENEIVAEFEMTLSMKVLPK